MSPLIEKHRAPHQHSSHLIESLFESLVYLTLSSRADFDAIQVVSISITLNLSFLMGLIDDRNIGSLHFRR